MQSIHGPRHCCCRKAGWKVIFHAESKCACKIGHFTYLTTIKYKYTGLTFGHSPILLLYYIYWGALQCRWSLLNCVSFLKCTKHCIMATQLVFAVWPKFRSFFVTMQVMSVRVTYQRYAETYCFYNILLSR